MRSDEPGSGTGHRPDVPDPFSDVPEVPEVIYVGDPKGGGVSRLGRSPVGSGILREKVEGLARIRKDSGGLLKKLKDFFTKPVPSPGPKPSPKPSPKPEPQPHPEEKALRNPEYGGAPSWSAYQARTRSQIDALKKELKEATDALKEGSKSFHQNSELMKLEHEKVKKMADELAGHLKAAIQNEAAAMNLTREQAAELKLLIDEMKDAVKNLKVGKRFNLKKIGQYTKDAIELSYDLTCYALALSCFLVYFGYLELEEPAPFDPRHTKAGKLLFDGYKFGFNVSCKSSFGSSDSITSLLSGDLNEQQSQVLIQRLKDQWDCQIVISPGNDIVLKGQVEDAWVKGLKIKYNLPMYDGLNRKLDFHYKHCFGYVDVSVGINRTPLVTLETMFGSKQLSAGCLIDYDSVSGVVRRLASGGVCNLFGLSSSVMMAKVFPAAGQQPLQENVRHELSSSVQYQVSDSTSVGGQLTYNFESHDTAISVGIEHKIDASSCVKAKVTNEGHLTAMLQQMLGEKASVSLCGMVNLRDLEANPRLGLSISIAP